MMGKPLSVQGFNPFLSCSRNAALLFINSTVTAIIFHSRSYYIFDSHSRDSRGFTVSNGTSVLLKFSCLQQVENYIEVIHLGYQGRERQYFQSQFLEIEVENLDESCQNINGAKKQICRNSAYSKRKEQVTGLQRKPQKILKMKKHGDVKRNVKVDTKVKQLMTLETQKLKTDVDFQKESNIGVSSDVCKEKFQSYSKKLKLPKMKKPKNNGEKEGTHSGNIVKKFKEMVHESPFYVCQVCHRYLYKRSVQHFERNLKNESSNPINVFSFNGYLNAIKKLRKVKLLASQCQINWKYTTFLHIFMEFGNLKKY